MNEKDEKKTPKLESRKSANKAAGHKSTLVCNDKLYMTSFGKGNDAVVEKIIDTNDYENFPEMPLTPVSLKVTNANEQKIIFQSTRPNVDKEKKFIAENPTHNNKDKAEKIIGGDMLGLKDVLEKRYFEHTGEKFDNNLHIQIIHNILDIEKILSVYATNISVVINHICDCYIKEYLEDEYDLNKNDFIGYMSSRNTFYKFMNPTNPKFNFSEKTISNIQNSKDTFEKLLNSRKLSYFSIKYDIPKKDKDGNVLNELQLKAQKKRIFHLVALAGQLRQCIFHSKNNTDRTWLYRLDEDIVDPNQVVLEKEYKDTLDYFFNNRFDKINSDFLGTNIINLKILKDLDLFNCSFDEVLRLYYDFIVIKSYKNFGFSIKKIREQMLENNDSNEITNTNNDSFRSKLYKLIDFIIFYHYYKDEENAQRNVDFLRASRDDESKEELYIREGNNMWRKYKDYFLDFPNILRKTFDNENNTDENDSNKIKTNEILNNYDINEYKNKCNVSYFAKLIYAMTFFLDGKEINDLITTLINKFDNIRSLIETATYNRIVNNIGFIPDYKFFENCEKHVSDLNIIKNISRMKKPSEDAKKNMFIDALSILGVPKEMSNDELNAIIDKELKIEYDKNGKKIKGKHPFRNFIANNVIENTRFIYVIKFCNPSNVRNIVNNTNVTKFVLNRMPDAQIERYYLSCVGNADSNSSKNEKINKLSQMMKEMYFNSFSDVKMDIKEGSEAAVKKERYKAIVSLYLTVVYILVKNLVNINSRYVIAFHSLERDAELYSRKYKKKREISNNLKNISSNYLYLTTLLCDEGDSSINKFISKNERIRTHIKTDLTNASDKLGLDNVKLYRNYVAHLTAVRNCTEFIGDIKKIDSYFALYHFIMQRQLAKYSKKDSEYFTVVKEHDTYFKDLVKAYNSPFGYNVTRFKNLSIDALFDKNEVKEEPVDSGYNFKHSKSSKK